MWKLQVFMPHFPQKYTLAESYQEETCHSTLKAENGTKLSYLDFYNLLRIFSNRIKLYQKQDIPSIKSIETDINKWTRAFLWSFQRKRKKSRKTNARKLESKSQHSWETQIYNHTSQSQACRDLGIFPWKIRRTRTRSDETDGFGSGLIHFQGRCRTHFLLTPL